jgi:hypothetical protein
LSHVLVPQGLARIRKIFVRQGTGPLLDGEHIEHVSGHIFAEYGGERPPIADENRSARKPFDRDPGQPKLADGFRTFATAKKYKKTLTGKN